MLKFWIPVENAKKCYKSKNKQQASKVKKIVGRFFLPLTYPFVTVFYFIFHSQFYLKKVI